MAVPHVAEVSGLAKGKRLRPTCGGELARLDPLEQSLARAPKQVPGNEMEKTGGNKTGRSVCPRWVEARAESKRRHAGADNRRQNRMLESSDVVPV